MFRKTRMIINGIELPEEFTGGSLVNNIAITPDGTKYAVVSKTGFIIGDMPADGKLDIDGTKVTYQRGAAPGTFNLRNIVDNLFGGSGGSSTSRRRTFVQSQHGTSFHAQRIQTDGDIVITSGSGPYQNEIDEVHQGVESLVYKGSVGDIVLRTCACPDVHVKGLIREQPTFSGGTLQVSDLEGQLVLPADHRMAVDIHVSTGDITGSLAQHGAIQTSVGDINLDLYAPLRLLVKTSVGDKDITGMIKESKGVYLPPDRKIVGDLELKTSTGDITVTYKVK